MIGQGGQSRRVGFTLWLLLFLLAHKPGSGYFPNSRYRSAMIGIFCLRLSVRATLRAAPVIVSTVDLLHDLGFEYIGSG